MALATDPTPEIARLFPDFPEVHPAEQHPARQQAAPAARADLPSKIKLNPDNVRNGFAQLVLTLVELLRELLERQALRRIDGGSLTQGEIERLGETFCRLAEEIERLKEYFGFTDEDLNLNLGPLGRLR
jgi:hypothetical protein